MLSGAECSSIIAMVKVVYVKLVILVMELGPMYLPFPGEFWLFSAPCLTVYMHNVFYSCMGYTVQYL